MPDYHKVLFFGAYIEGWLLYTEQLADEIRFYRNQPAWEIGYIRDALLRSGKLVFDTGIHAKRWTHERAVATPSGIDGNPVSSSGPETQRYAVGRGQACSYKVGKIRSCACAKARAALGTRFDIGRFHDPVLVAGALPLALLEAGIESFIAAETGLSRVPFTMARSASRLSRCHCRRRDRHAAAAIQRLRRRRFLSRRFMTPPAQPWEN